MTKKQQNRLSSFTDKEIIRMCEAYSYFKAQELDWSYMCRDEVLANDCFKAVREVRPMLEEAVKEGIFRKLKDFRYKLTDINYSKPISSDSK